MELRVTATLGPASSTPDVIVELAEVAARFRLNASHLTPEQLGEWLARLHRIGEDIGRPLPVVVDLQGAKMRLGATTVRGELAPAVRLVLNAPAKASPAILHVPHPELFAQVAPGERLSLNDGRAELEVTEVAGDELRARVVRNGTVGPHKGINRADHPIRLAALTVSDRAALDALGEYPEAEVACSFVHDGHEAALFRAQARRHLVAKVERPEAMRHLDAIDAAFDELWFCRGDLGAQAGLAALGGLQAQFTEALQTFAHPAFLAGGVLEHLVDHPAPTRSEVVHLYDVEHAGWTGIVLSDETAIGRHPREVARLLAALRVRGPRARG